jgi:hypothetical protein
MSNRLGRAVLVVSALGYPLFQSVIRRFGRRGACVTELVTAGLMARDLAMIATGTPGRLRQVPALLLWSEVGAAAVASVAGAVVILDADAWGPQGPGGPSTAEIVRRAAVGSLFGLHTVRFWIYLQPDQGRRAPPPGSGPGST